MGKNLIGNRGNGNEIQIPQPIQDQLDAIDKQILVLMEMKADLIRNSVPRIIFQKEELPQEVFNKLLAEMQKG